MPSPVSIGDSSSHGQVARVSSDGELYVTETEREDNRLSRYKATVVDATIWAVLVDLSDTTNWPHDSTGRIDLSFLAIQVDRASNAVGSVDLGVVTRVDATNGDVSFVAGVSFVNVSDTNIRFSENYAPSQIKLGVSGGVLVSAVTNDVVTNSTAIQTDVALPSFRGAGTVNPAVGDVVVRFSYTSGGGYTASVRVLYHGEDTA